MAGGEGAKVNPPAYPSILEEFPACQSGGPRWRRHAKEGTGVLPEEGNIKQASGDSRVLTEMEAPNIVGRQKEQHPRNEGSADVSWGAVFTTDEYHRTCLVVGNLAFDCIYFGENPKLSTILKQKLRAGEDIESKKCTAMAIAAGAEWVSQGQPKRCPARRRIGALSSVTRTGET